MKKISDEDLIGYLLGALEPDEAHRIELALEQDLGLRDRLSVLEDQLSIMPDRFVEIDPPQGLAEKTLNTISIVDSSLSCEPEKVEPQKVLPSKKDVKFSNNGLKAEHELGSSNRNWSVMDMIVGAAVCFVVATLLLPSIANSRFQSNLTICQNNLRQIGYNLASHSDSFDGKFSIPNDGDQWQASFFVQRMRESGFECLPYMICPNDPGRKETAEVFREAWCNVSLRMPEEDFARTFNQPEQEVYADQIVSTDPVASANEPFASKCYSLRQSEAASGSYAFPAPCISDDNDATIVIPGSPNRVLCADAACFDNPGYRSRNHAGRGQNVLLGDLSVEYICETACLPTGDHIYTNSQGRVQPGFFPGDSVMYRGVIKAEKQSK